MNRRHAYAAREFFVQRPGDQVPVPRLAGYRWLQDTRNGEQKVGQVPIQIFLLATPRPLPEVPGRETFHRKNGEVTDVVPESVVLARLGDVTPVAAPDSGHGVRVVGLQSADPVELRDLVHQDPFFLVRNHPLATLSDAPELRFLSRKAWRRPDLVRSCVDTCPFDESERREGASGARFPREQPRTCSSSAV